MTKGFDTTPKPAFLLAMQNQKWDVSGALSELIDNSFGPGRGAAQAVTITHYPQKRIVEVLDNGKGMDALGRIFQLGNTIGRTPGDIGLYGSGGTMALLWLADRVEIWTMRAEGIVQTDSVDWKKQIKDDAFPIVDDTWKLANRVNTPPELFAHGHGTLIRLHLSKERKFYTNNVQANIASNFAPAFRQGKKITWRTSGRDAAETLLTEAAFVFAADPPPVKINIALDVNGDHLQVTGEVGLVPDLPQSKSVVNVGFGPRTIVRTRECYNPAEGPQRHYTGIAGWLDLGEGWQPYLATTKDALNDQPTWEVLMAHVYEQIKPLLDKIQREKMTALFDDLKLSLNAALNGRNQIVIDGSGDAGDQYPEGGPGDGKGEEGDRAGFDGPSGNGVKKKHDAISEILIEQCNDEEMQSTLCRAEVTPNDVLVAVNVDHHAVQEAMESRPENRMALMLMITREISSEVTRAPAILNRLFNRAELEKLDGLAENDRPRLVSRFLMDRVRTAGDAPEAPAAVAA